MDTCAAEFEAYTPYYYSTYGDENERRESGKRKIMILGGGPNRIGQGIEFDYCCVHAAFALRELGFETIMVNSNPETVSTDYDTSDKLYFEPLTLEDVLNIYDQEKPEGVLCPVWRPDAAESRQWIGSGWCAYSWDANRKHRDRGRPKTIRGDAGQAWLAPNAQRIGHKHQRSRGDSEEQLAIRCSLGPASFWVVAPWS